MSGRDGVEQGLRQGDMGLSVTFPTRPLTRGWAERREVAKARGP